MEFHQFYDFIIESCRDFYSSFIFDFSIGMLTACSGFSVMKYTTHYNAGFALAVSGTFLAVSAYGSRKSMSLRNVSTKLLVGGAVGFLLGKFGKSALGSFDCLNRGVTFGPPKDTQIVNVEVFNEMGNLKIAGGSIAPVFVFKSIPGSKFAVMLGNYVVNTIRLSKHSSVYNKAVFVGLMMLKYR